MLYKVTLEIDLRIYITAGNTRVCVGRLRGSSGCKVDGDPAPDPSRRLLRACKLRYQQVVAHDLVFLGQDLAKVPGSLYETINSEPFGTTSSLGFGTHRPLRNSALRAVSQRNVAAGSSRVSGIGKAPVGPAFSWNPVVPGVSIAPGWTA